MKNWTLGTLSLACFCMLLPAAAIVAAFTWKQLGEAHAAVRTVEASHATLVWLGRSRAELYRSAIADLHAIRAPSPSTMAERERARDVVRARIDSAAALTLPFDYMARIKRVRDFLKADYLAVPNADILPASELIDIALFEQDGDRRRAEQAALDCYHNLERGYLTLVLLVLAATLSIVLRIRYLGRERNAAHNLLLDSEERYRHLIDTAHEGIWMLDPKGRTRFANARLAALFGVDEGLLAGRPMYEFLGENPRAQLAALLSSEPAHECHTYDMRVRRADGSEGWALTSARPVQNSDGTPGGTLLMLSDISERKQAEMALASARQVAERSLMLSEDRLHRIIHALPLALFLKDTESRIILMNKACEEQWGLPFEEVCGTRGEAIFPIEQMDQFVAFDKAVFEAGSMTMRDVLAWNAKHQDNRYYQTYKVPVHDAEGQPQYLICISVDITERERAEAKLAGLLQQNRQLTAHLETAKEEERRRIARDIHDDLGQNLLALKLDVSLLHNRTGNRHARLHEGAGRVLDTIDATIRSVRSIINDLHPSTLELGLAPAAEWLLGEFGKRNGIATSLVITEPGVQLLDPMRTAAAFRVLQEALANVVRHAGASQVEVTLAFDEEVVMVVADNGAGMAPRDAGKPEAFGLRSMRERLSVFGGALQIDSAPGKGTRLKISLPLPVLADA